MDMTMSPEQQLLLDTAVRFIDERCPIDVVRAYINDADTLDPRYLVQAGELGWFAFFVPPEYGGGSVTGSPVHDAAIVSQARGRALQPGPFVAANVVALAVALHGNDEQQALVLPELASGRRFATWALCDRGGSPDPGALVAHEVEGGYRLRGTASLVEEPELASWVLVTASHGDGVTQLLVPRDTDGLTVTMLETLDLTRRLGEVRFDDVVVPRSAVVGEPRVGVNAVRCQVDLAATLLVADTVGAIDHLLWITVDYAAHRVAFGRPIGSFQAIKHLLATTSMYVEAAIAVAMQPARLLLTDRPDACEVVSIAKSFVGDAAMEAAQACFQVHGGIAFTWEHALHLYLRRVTASRAMYGDPAWHRERICRLHAL